tara:strand:- start:1092 stop:1694 length:603 start_codon:yes stop_codon:yes gene_type:complete
MEKVAILIDCWGEDYLEYPAEKQIPYKTIDTFLQTKTVDTIIMSSYDTGESIQPKLYNPWIPNTKDYMANHKLSWSKKVERDSVLLAEDLTNNLDHFLRHTNKGFVKRYKTWNTPILFLHYPWELPMIKDIKEVFIFGFDWKICVANRPLGYNFWLKNTKANIYFDPKGVEYVKKTNDNWFEEYKNSKKYPELKTIRETE